MIGGKKRSTTRLFGDEALPLTKRCHSRKKPRLLTPISPTFQNSAANGVDFLALPTNLMFRVLSMLDFADFINLLATCRSLHAAAEGNWLRLIRLRWPDFADDSKKYKSADAPALKQYFIRRLKLECMPCTAFYKSASLMKPTTGSSLETVTAIAFSEDQLLRQESPQTTLSEEPARKQFSSLSAISDGTSSTQIARSRDGDSVLASQEDDSAPPAAPKNRIGSQKCGQEFLGGNESLAFELLQQVNRLIQARVVRNDVPDASTPTFVKTGYLASLQLCPFTLRLADFPRPIVQEWSQMPLPVYYVFQVDRKSYAQPFGVQAMLFSQVNTASCPIALNVSWVAATESDGISSGATPSSVYNYWKIKYMRARGENLAPQPAAAETGAKSSARSSSSVNSMYPGFNSHARCSFSGQRGYYEFSISFRNEPVLVVNVSRFHHHRLGVPNFAAIDKELAKLGYPVNNAWRRYIVGVIEQLYSNVFDKYLISTRRHNRKLTLNDAELLLDAVGHFELWDWIDLLLYERLKHQFEQEPSQCLELEKSWFKTVLNGLI